MKNIKNCKLFLEAKQEFEVTRKRRKKSLWQFDTLFRIDPTIQDEFTEEAPLPRLEKNLSSHTKSSTVANSCFTFRPLHYGTCREYLCSGKGDTILCPLPWTWDRIHEKQHKCFEGHQLKEMREWQMQKIDLNELKNIGMMGV